MSMERIFNQRIIGHCLQVNYNNFILKYIHFNSNHWSSNGKVYVLYTCFINKIYANISIYSAEHSNPSSRTDSTVPIKLHPLLEFGFYIDLIARCVHQIDYIRMLLFSFSSNFTINIKINLFQSFYACLVYVRTIWALARASITL